MDYNPFGKPFDLVDASDLCVLNDVREGWFVEYKRQVGDPKTVAKSISAMANSRGGWIIYGVEAPDGVSTAIPGVEKLSAPNATARIRDSIAAHVNPVPSFDIRCIDGNGTTLASDRVIICVRVPRGVRPPYLHSSGVVYVRIADKSDPVRLTDRAKLDELYAHAKENRERLSRFFQDRTPASFREQPYAQVFLLPDPHGVETWQHELPFERFADLMKKTVAPTAVDSMDSYVASFSMPFSHCQTLGGALIASQPNGPTWRVGITGRHVITTPLTWIPAHNPRTISQFLRGYAHADEFARIWLSTELRADRLIDLTMWAAMLLVILRQVAVMQKEFAFDGYDGSLWCRLRLRNIDASAIYLDTPSFIHHVSSFGPPITHEGDLDIPTSSIDELFPLGPCDGSTDSVLARWGELVRLVGGALGMPWGESLPNDEARSRVASGATEWLQTLKRAAEVQRIRKSNKNVG